MSKIKLQKLIRMFASVFAMLLINGFVRMYFNIELFSFGFWLIVLLVGSSFLYGMSVNEWLD